MWIITRDHLHDPEDPDAEGVFSRDLNPEAKLEHQFRLYDGDGELYYEGFSDAEDFRPLDEFGTPNSGATEIRYRPTAGTWTTL